MAFIVDRTNLRTYDPERGYELFTNGGGSDGTCRFKLTRPGGEFFFSAHSLNEKLSNTELEIVSPKNEKKIIVWVVHNWTEEWRGVIREALTAFVVIHGSADPEMRAFVRFGVKGSVFDA